MQLLTHTPETHAPWNKGKLTGQKPPFKLKEIWAIRVRLQLNKRFRDLALFNLALDSKLRSCDLVKLKVNDIAHGTRIVITSSQHRTRLKKTRQQYYSNSDIAFQ